MRRRRVRNGLPARQAQVQRGRLSDAPDRVLELARWQSIQTGDQE